MLDFGGVYASYCVDLTRTVSIGKASPARPRGVRARFSRRTIGPSPSIRPGASRLDIDQAARDTLGRYGLAEAFGHGTGHGLGIEVHEDPRITRRRPDVDTRDEAVAAGMVFTIEPGAYLPDWGGVRIEDDVLVTADGVEVLTNVTPTHEIAGSHFDHQRRAVEADPRSRARARPVGARDRAGGSASQGPEGRCRRPRGSSGGGAAARAAGARPRRRRRAARRGHGGSRRTRPHPSWPLGERTPNPTSSWRSSSRRSSARSTGRPNPVRRPSSRSATRSRRARCSASSKR